MLLFTCCCTHTVTSILPHSYYHIHIATLILSHSYCYTHIVTLYGRHLTIGNLQQNLLSHSYCIIYNFLGNLLSYSYCCIIRLPAMKQNVTIILLHFIIKKIWLVIFHPIILMQLFQYLYCYCSIELLNKLI